MTDATIPHLLTCATCGATQADDMPTVPDNMQHLFYMCMTCAEIGKGKGLKLLQAPENPTRWTFAKDEGGWLRPLSLDEVRFMPKVTTDG